MSWHKVPPRIKDMVAYEAQKTQPNLRSGGRDADEKLAHTYMGFTVEAMDFYLRGEIMEWVAQRRRLRGKDWDGGIDRDDGVNIKAIPEDGGFVVVNDDTAEKYLVYEYCPAQGVRRLGTFEKRNIRPIVLPDGTIKRGVYRHQIIT